MINTSPPAQIHVKKPPSPYQRTQGTGGSGGQAMAAQGAQHPSPSTVQCMPHARTASENESVHTAMASWQHLRVRSGAPSLGRHICLPVRPVYDKRGNLRTRQAGRISQGQARVAGPCMRPAGGSHDSRSILITCKEDTRPSSHQSIGTLHQQSHCSQVHAQYNICGHQTHTAALLRDQLGVVT